MSNAPSVKPFDYVFIPAEQQRVVESRRFNGTDDEQLRAEIASYFRQGGTMSLGQQDDFSKNLEAQIQQRQQQQQQHQQQQGSDAAAALPINPALLNEAVSQSTFEIVPVTLPTRANRFVATSLYIDDAGRFKELPLNYRASKLAGRDIRGDAFLLSNHDDPAADEWCRVDTTVERFEELFENPPSTTLDTGNQAQMAAAGMMRENEAKVVTPEEAVETLRLKAAGNTAYSAGQIQTAVECYSEAIMKSSARLDRLDNEQEVATARKLCYLNRAQCFLQVGNFNAAAVDAKAVLSVDATNAKGWYRLAIAEKNLKDFDSARAALRQCVENGGPADDCNAMLSEIAMLEKQFQENERKRYRGMFGE